MFICKGKPSFYLRETLVKRLEMRQGVEAAVRYTGASQALRDAEHSLPPPKRPRLGKNTIQIVRMLLTHGGVVRRLQIAPMNNAKMTKCESVGAL